jgi:hypothetical protein
MIVELEKLLDKFMGPGVRVRCFAHTLNLVVKVIYFIMSTSSCRYDSLTRQSFGNSHEPAKLATKTMTTNKH